jgi:hypothetical protein
MIGNDVACSGIIVLKSPIIIEGKEEVIGKILYSKRWWELMELYSLVVIDVGMVGL